MARAVLLGAAEEERLKRLEVIERKRRRGESMPTMLPDTSFKATYRLSKANFEDLCEDLIPLLKVGQRNTAVRPEIKILAALHFYASGGYQKNIGNHNTINVSKTCMYECLQEITEVLNTPNILKKYIRFPKSQAERESVSQRFMELSGLPGVLGCIDGTHCAIIRPKDSEEVYFNRKHYHSLNVMVICDADLRILYVDPSFGGASHDSHVWNGSLVKTHMMQLHENGHFFWFLGDSGYAQRPWMMIPILDAPPNSPEEYYTKRHCSTRNVVERCFGVLKTRFRCLLAHRVMHYHPTKAAKIVNACVVLHNLINDARITIDEDAMERDRRRQPAHVPYSGANHQHTQDDHRQELIDRLWRSRQARN